MFSTVSSIFARLKGVVPGGGVALLRATKDTQVRVKNQEQAVGVQLVFASASAPLRQMAVNAGQSPDVLEQAVRMTLNSEDKIIRGVDFATGQIVDMYAAGIIDPVKVTTTALRNAVSVASSLITTNCAIVEADSLSQN